MRHTIRGGRYPVQGQTTTRPSRQVLKPDCSPSRAAHQALGIESQTRSSSEHDEYYFRFPPRALLVEVSAPIEDAAMVVLSPLDTVGQPNSADAAGFPLVPGEPLGSLCDVYHLESHQ